MTDVQPLTSTSEISVYDSTAITKLEGVEAIRKNPGMYIGGTGLEGLHHLIWEVVDNSVDEALAGYCTRVEVTLLRDGGCRVRDDGRGIPVDRNPQLGDRPALEVVMTHLHSGAKFGSGTYKVSGGLHGVGLTAVNALSRRLEALVWRDGYEWRMTFEEGKPVTSLEKGKRADQTGTEITFWPDPTLFPEVRFDLHRIEQRLRETAYLVRGLKIVLVDERESPVLVKEYHFTGGIREFVAELNKAKGACHKNICEYSARASDFLGASDLATGDAEVEVALQWSKEYSEAILSFANTINTPHGGSHEQGFKKALTTVLNRYARETGHLKEKDENYHGEDIRQGLTAVISVRLTNPQYEGQTKAKLVNREIEGFVQQATHSEFARWLQEHPEDAAQILRKVQSAAAERIELERRRRQERQKSELEGGSALPGKLADCSVRDPEKRELFIVEGDSAGGSAIKARNREFQAILPIRGKILNVEKHSLQKTLGNSEIKNLILALGCGIGESFDIKRLRYHKICILCDADVDGAHIRTLLLTLFYRLMPDLVKHGHVYVCRPPLYKATHGQKSVYLLDDREKEEFLKQQKDAEKWSFSRHKGLGEMDAEELWETTMDPARRALYKVSVEDAAMAEEVVARLMGEDTAERKEFIAANAEGVEMIDV